VFARQGGAVVASEPIDIDGERHYLGYEVVGGQLRFTFRSRICLLAPLIRDYLKANPKFPARKELEELLKKAEGLERPSPDRDVKKVVSKLGKEFVDRVKDILKAAGKSKAVRELLMMVVDKLTKDNRCQPTKEEIEYTAQPIESGRIIIEAGDLSKLLTKDQLGQLGTLFKKSLPESTKDIGVFGSRAFAFKWLNDNKKKLRDDKQPYQGGTAGGNENNDLDLVYELAGDQFLVLESKGGGSRPGARSISVGGVAAFAEQGSPYYLREIATLMSKGSGQKGRVGQALVRLITKPQSNQVWYYKVQVTGNSSKTLEDFLKSLRIVATPYRLTLTGGKTVPGRPTLDDLPKPGTGYFK
jgi:hypothetical protein